MERLSVKDIPVEQVYADSRQTERRLRQLFHRPYSLIPFRNHLPPVVLFDSTNNEDVENPDFERNLSRSFTVYPNRPQSELDHAWFNTKKMIKRKIRAEYEPHTAFYYDRKGFDSDLSYLRVTGEEITHHVTLSPFRTKFEVSPQLFIDMNGCIGERGYEFGRVLYEAYESLTLLREEDGIDFDLKPAVETAEFYVPLALAYLLKDNYKEYAGRNYQMPAWPLFIYPPMAGENYDRAFTIMDKINHLPSYAGHKLLMRFGGDAQAVMAAHPNLANIPPHQLLEQYIKPLLTEPMG